MDVLDRMALSDQDKALQFLALSLDSLGAATQQIESRQADLTQRYMQTLRENLFTNRSELRPAILPRVAAGEAQALLEFFRQPQPQRAFEHGVQLCQLGLSEQTLLRLGSGTRHFILQHLESADMHSALDAADTYQISLLHGFIQTRQDIILQEQERIRSALQKALSRYTVQMELAAGVAWATNSILDLDMLLNTAAALICERFELYYVSIFLLGKNNLWAVLRASAADAQAREEVLPQDYKFEIGDHSLIDQAIAAKQPKISLDISKEAPSLQAHCLPAARSVIAVPILVHGKVIGAFAVQRLPAAAFAAQDAAALRTLADQLANAVENARLFSALQDSEEKYRTILEIIEEGYYEIDINLNFTFANQAACNILGSGFDEVLDMNYLQHVVPQDLKKLSQTVERVYRSGEPDRGIEYLIFRKDGSSRVVETFISRSNDAAGQPTGFRGILRDVTRRKQVEQLFIERKALERSNQELEQFAYVASHDLQEPLRKIQTFGDRLRSKNWEALNESGRDYLERMLNASLRMQTLINDLLALSRIKTTSQPFTSVDLAQVAQEVVSDLEAQIERIGGRVEVGKMHSIEADPLQMRQLLQNLIGNGLKFHRPEELPVIRVFSRRVGMPGADRAAEDGSFCEITVMDNGIGFDEKYLDRIFEPFQRLHTRTEYEGTGIGLSICQTIAQRHAGSLTAHSAPGRGAAFIITLPVQQYQSELTHE